MKTVFLDRDGVINEILFFENLGILETPFHPKQFKLLPKVGTAIRKLNQLGFKVIVVSNQPGVGMGHFSVKTLIKINKRMKDLLAMEGAHLDGIYYCLHHPEKGKGIYRKKCVCRKPKAGLLDEAKKDFGVSFSRSYLVGDSIHDIQAGLERGVKTILLGRLKCDLCDLMAKKGVRPHYITRNLFDAVKQIEKLEKNGKKK